jgi:NADH-quinone oxidoreductase subunit L
VPLGASIVAGVGGLLLGWLTYREQTAGARDPLERRLGPVYTLLKNKYYFDELYHRIFVQPAYWFAETFTYRWIDRGAIDGLLHAIGRFALRVGAFLRGYIDLPIVNGSGDLVGNTVKRAGSEFRFIQTGRVQQYLIVGLLFTGALLAYLLLVSP